MSTVQLLSSEPPFSTVPGALLTDEILSRLPLEEYKTAQLVCSSFHHSCKEIHQRLETRKQILRNSKELEELLKSFGVSSSRPIWKQRRIHGKVFLPHHDLVMKYFSDLKKRIEEINDKLPVELKSSYTADDLARYVDPNILIKFLYSAKTYAIEQLEPAQLEREKKACSPLTQEEENDFPSIVKKVFAPFIILIDRIATIRDSIILERAEAASSKKNTQYSKTLRKVILETFPTTLKTPCQQECYPIAFFVL